MSNRSGHRGNNNKATGGSNNWTKDNELFGVEDSDLFESISEYMAGYFDSEDVQNDPDKPAMDKLTMEMINDYQGNNKRYKDNIAFINEALGGIEQHISPGEEIKEIKKEIEENRLDEITAEWVRDWHRNKDKNNGSNTHSEEIRDYILESLRSETTNQDLKIPSVKKGGLSRPFIRYASISVAAIITFFIVIRTLLPSYNPDKLFSKYYEPFGVISSVTRNSSAEISGSYLPALEMYKQGNYSGAVEILSDVISEDNSLTEPIFFMGVTELALGNFTQAISTLSEVTSRSSEYGKEAQWYLGLAYLKTGEKEKALSCFTPLTQTQNFYRKRAENIVRRLR